METFKSELLALIIGLIMIGICVSIYRIMKNKFADIPGAMRDRGRPVRSRSSGRDDDTEVSGRMGPIRWLKYWFGELVSSYGIYGEIFRRIPKRETLLSAAFDLVIMAVVSVGMSMFCSYSDSGSDLYMTTFMTLMYVSAALILFSRCVDGARSVYLPCCILILTGIALAVLLYLSPMQAVKQNHIGPPDQMVMHHVVSVIFGLAVFPLIRMCCRAKRRTDVLVVLNILLILFCALLFTTKKIHGAANWLTFGSFQFQATEVTKVLTLAILALTLTHSQISEVKRLVFSSITMVINCFTLAVCNEYGTLMVLCIVFVGMCLIFLKDLKYFLILVAAATVLAVILLFVAKECYAVVYPEKAAASATTPTTAPTTVPTTAPAASDPTATGETGADGSSEEKPEPNPIVSLLAEFYKKFDERFLLFLAPEKYESSGAAYQWSMSQEALVISDWFGSPYDIAVPVARSDFIYNYMIVRMGLMYGFGVLVMLSVMLCAGMLRALRNPASGEAAVAVSFLVAMVVQSLIATASSTGNFAIVGLPFVFLAYGGTAMLTNYTMLVFLIYATQAKPLTPALKKGRKAIGRKED